MTRNYLADLAEYLNWSDSQAIDWLEQVTEEQWIQPAVSSFGSIWQTALHMVSAKKIWIDFWTKVNQPVFLSTVFNGAKSDLLELWKLASADLQDIIDNYPEEDYSKPVYFVYPNGRQGQLLFWQSVQHMVNHATYHRGQLVTQLRQAGFTDFSNTDLATFYIKQELLTSR